MSPITEKIITGIITAIGGAVAVYGVPILRKSLKNTGKTNVEIASEELDAAMKKVQAAHDAEEAAKATPGTDDDVAAEADLKKSEKLAEIAKKHKDRARQLAAIADAISDGLEKAPPTTPG